MHTGGETAGAVGRQRRGDRSPAAEKHQRGGRARGAAAPTQEKRGRRECGAPSSGTRALRDVTPPHHPRQQEDSTGRTTHSVLVEDVNNNRELPCLRAVRNNDDAADLRKPCEEDLLWCGCCRGHLVERVVLACYAKRGRERSQMRTEGSRSADTNEALHRNDANGEVMDGGGDYKISVRRCGSSIIYWRSER